MKNTMNLYKKYKQDSVKQKSLGKTGVAIGLSIALLLIIAAFGIRYTIEKIMVQSDVDDLTYYVTNADNLQKYETSKKLSDEANQLNSFKQILDDLNVVFDEKDAVSSDILIAIYNAKPKSLNISQMSINGAVVNISYSSKDQTASSRFVSELKQTNRIKEVKYDGYEYNSDSETYSGNVSLILGGNF